MSFGELVLAIIIGDAIGMIIASGIKYVISKLLVMRRA